MIHSPLLEILDKLSKWWKSHTIPYKAWYFSFSSVAAVAGIIGKHNWRLSIGLAGVSILIICVFAFPVAWYEKKHKKGEW